MSKPSPQPEPKETDRPSPTGVIRVRSVSVGPPALVVGSRLPQRKLYAVEIFHCVELDPSRAWRSDLGDLAYLSDPLGSDGVDRRTLVASFLLTPEAVVALLRESDVMCTLETSRTGPTVRHASLGSAPTKWDKLVGESVQEDLDRIPAGLEADAAKFSAAVAALPKKPKEIEVLRAQVVGWPSVVRRAIFRIERQVVATAESLILETFRAAEAQWAMANQRWGGSPPEKSSAPE